MTKHRIHVNQSVIRANHKNGENKPVLTVKSGKLNRYAHEVVILGPSRVVYAGDGSGRKPLSCGARVWVETESELIVRGEPEHEN